MIYSFITDEDLKSVMKQYFITQLTTDATVLPQVEAAAFSQIKAKLNGRYDFAKLFPPIVNWSSSIAFLKDSYCYKAGKIYVALQAGTNQDPAAQPSSYWKESDPRDQMLVIIACNMTIYLALRRNKPSKMAEDVIDEYAAALEYLDKIKNLEENPDWPLLEDGATNIQWGSNEKLDHYY